jgi:hypothetical protein
MKRTLHCIALRWDCATLIAVIAIHGFGAVAQQTGVESEALSQSVIFLGCGEVDGPGVVMQLDQHGEVLGVASLAGTPYGLALYRGGLLAAVPGGTTGAGSIVRIGRPRRRQAKCLRTRTRDFFIPRPTICLKQSWLLTISQPSAECWAARISVRWEQIHWIIRPWWPMGTQDGHDCCWPAPPAKVDRDAQDRQVQTRSVEDPKTTNWSLLIRSQPRGIVQRRAFSHCTARRGSTWISIGMWNPSVPPTGKVFQLAGAEGLDICGPSAVEKSNGRSIVGRSRQGTCGPSSFTDGDWGADCC